METDNLPLFLEEETWLLCIKKMTLHAHNCLGGRACSMEPVDIAVEAITDVCSGQRAWDRARYPKLLNHLYWVVKSKVYDLMTSFGNKAEVPYDAEAHDAHSHIPDLEPLPEKALEGRMFLNEVKTLLQDEKPLLEVVEAIVECGLTDRADIAHVLGISPDEVTNRRKKLQRRLLPLIHRGRSVGSKRSKLLR